MVHEFEQPGKAQLMIKNLYAGMKGVPVKPSFETAPTGKKFSAHILNHVSMPLPVIPLTLGYYDGFSDPDDFLQKYEGIARNQRWADETKCMEFPPLLEGVARQGFNNLPAPVISYYDDLRTRFLLNFHNMSATRRTHVECHDIKHERGESLGQFIDRYCQEVASVPNCAESLKVSGFIHGICQERHLTLWQRLRKCPPETLVEAIREAYEHMRAEEDTSRDSDTRENKKALIRSLTKSLKEIYVTEPISKTFKKPAHMFEYARRDKSKFCDFHDDFGHETNRCKALVDKVVARLKRGELKHLKPGKDESGGYKKESKGLRKTRSSMSFHGRKRRKFRKSHYCHMKSSRRTSHASAFTKGNALRWW
ncbi:uncharacterized protein [Rutidosis leptorrhynchoides]|uniref:uncharacterized protein n=1 Tax=Rutidosis leptorrhynchoides TaxID=125765 RepID=UPI003A99B73E